jgi:hypothetical protein
MINIEFDEDKVTKDEIRALSVALQKIVSSATGVQDTFVYANCAQVRVKVAPIEAVIRLSERRVDDADKIMDEIESLLREWKKEHSFLHPVNLTLVQGEDWGVIFRIFVQRIHKSRELLR